MQKKDELALPDSCLNRSADDEFLFVLCERDAAISETVRFWAAERVKRGLNRIDDSKIQRALREADRMESARLAKDGEPILLERPVPFDGSTPLTTQVLDLRCKGDSGRTEHPQEGAS